MTSIPSTPRSPSFDPRAALIQTQSLQDDSYGIAGIARVLLHSLDDPPDWIDNFTRGGLITAIVALQADAAYRIEFLTEQLEQDLRHIQARTEVSP